LKNDAAHALRERWVSSAVENDLHYCLLAEDVIARFIPSGACETGECKFPLLGSAREVKWGRSRDQNRSEWNSRVD
jgi:hypothetical protein